MIFGMSLKVVVEIMASLPGGFMIVLGTNVCGYTILVLVITCLITECKIYLAIDGLLLIWVRMAW